MQLEYVHLGHLEDMCILKMNTYSYFLFFLLLPLPYICYSSYLHITSVPYQNHTTSWPLISIHLTLINGLQKQWHAPQIDTIGHLTSKSSGQIWHNYGSTLFGSHFVLVQRNITTWAVHWCQKAVMWVIHALLIYNNCFQQWMSI